MLPLPPLLPEFPEFPELPLLPEFPEFQELPLLPEFPLFLSLFLSLFDVSSDLFAPDVLPFEELPSDLPVFDLLPDLPALSLPLSACPLLVSEGSAAFSGPTATMVSREILVVVSEISVRVSAMPSTYVTL